MQLNNIKPADGSKKQRSGWPRHWLRQWKNLCVAKGQSCVPGLPKVGSKAVKCVATRLPNAASFTGQGQGGRCRSPAVGAEHMPVDTIDLLALSRPVSCQQLR